MTAQRAADDRTSSVIGTSLASGERPLAAGSHSSLPAAGPRRVRADAGRSVTLAGCCRDARSRAGRVQALQQLVRGQLDLLVAPLGGTVVAGDETHAMHPSEIPVHEGVARLGLVRGSRGEAAMT